jgi:hypothetical protein
MNGSPLFMHVQRKLGRNLPREVTEDEQAEIAYAFEKLAAGERYVQARHLKVALRAMGFPVKVCCSADSGTQACKHTVLSGCCRTVRVWHCLRTGETAQQQLAGHIPSRVLEYRHR